MDFLNVGGLELLFLAGLAIIIVGPARAAEIAGEIGRIIARARRTINSMTEDLRTQAREETEPLRSARDSLRDVESNLRRPFDLSEPRPNTGRAEPPTEDPPPDAPPADEGELPAEESPTEDTR